MANGQTFEFNGHKYTIDIIGPRTTLLVCDDGSWQSVDTDLLQRFLEQQ